MTFDFGVKITPSSFVHNVIYANSFQWLPVSTKSTGIE